MLSHEGNEANADAIRVPEKAAMSPPGKLAVGPG
jgi:hypothetical protein